MPKAYLKGLIFLLVNT